MTDTDKKAKVHVSDMQIFTWSPDRATVPHLAIIGGLPMHFTGSTSAIARERAEQWRTEELDRLARIKANAKAAAAKVTARNLAKKELTQ